MQHMSRMKKYCHREMDLERRREWMVPKRVLRSCAPKRRISSPYVELPRAEFASDSPSMCSAIISMYAETHYNYLNRSVCDVYIRELG